MIGATGAEVSKLFGIRGIHESQDFRKIAEVADQPPDAGNPAAQERKNIERQIAAILQRLHIARHRKSWSPFFSTWSITNCPSWSMMVIVFS